VSAPVAPSASLAILEAVPEDAEAILALQRLAYESEARRYRNWSIPPLVETLADVRAHITRDVVLKAMLAERLVGSVRGVVAGRTCEVGRLIVHPAVQRQGIGSALLSAIERRVSGLDAYELFTGDRSVENLRLYERHGYRESRREPLPTGVALVYLRKPAARDRQ
jgi:GNAT superfamily N-acetyltransferase